MLWGAITKRPNSVVATVLGQLDHGPTFYLVATAFLLVVYAPSLSIPPRADEFFVIYGFQAYSGLIDTVLNTYSWPRTLLGGDVHMFRPLGHALMAAEWSLFGYRFWLYQLAAVLLHGLVATQLFLILRRILRIGFSVACGLVIWCTCFPLAGEAVMWDQTTEIVLFGVFLLAALYHWWQVEPLRHFAALPYVYFVLAALTIDQGSVLAAFAAYCAAVALVGHFRAWESSALRFYLGNAVVAGVLVLAIQGLSYLDLIRTGHSLADFNEAVTSSSSLIESLGNSFRVAWFWLAPFFVPAHFQFIAGHRMIIAHVPWSLVFRLVNWLLLGGLAIGLIEMLLQISARREKIRIPWPIVALLAVLCGSYILLFTFGRIAQKGMQVVTNELYVAYPFGLYIAILLGTAFVIGSKDRMARIANRIAIAAVLGIGLMQAGSLTFAANQMKKYFANDNALYDAVLTASREGLATSPYTFTFSFEQPCKTNYVLPFMYGLLGLDHDVTLAEAVFPRWYRPDGGETLLACPTADASTPVDIRSDFENSSHPAKLAFEDTDDPNSFMEALLPTKVEVELRKPVSLQGYTLSSRASGARMPAKWRVFSLENGKGLQLIDEQSETTWQAYQTRRYKLAAPVQTQHVIFEFTVGLSGILRIDKMHLDVADAESKR